MNIKSKQTAKRLISGFIAVTTAITFMPQVPAFAQTGTTTYSYDGYDVEYSILNEWDNGQSVEVKITNTGEESILNWAFKYDSDGTIDGIWNAMILENQGDDYLIKNNGWNYEIAPNQSVTFGYTLTDGFSVPTLFELHSNKVDVTDGYTASINITESWDNGINGEIVITNTSLDNALEAWTLAFDSNFIINNLWNGRLVENEDNHYVISSEMWTNPISVGSSTVIGFSASIESEVTPEILNCVLSEVEIESLEINWEDTTDTDRDGLPDVYEKNVYGTDINNIDTDDDRLPDGYEVLTLRTDPTSKDTDNNGTTDDEEDFDSDNLANYEEYLLDTDPYKADTDGDGLTDGDEVNIYNTDPLKYDTDGDGVIDSDEILLGLDPNDPTDGDTEIKQSIGEDELRVNKYNDNFKISIDVEASNNVKRFIKQGVSRYSSMLSNNRSIIGLPISIEYNAGTIKSGTISFRLDDEFVDSNSHFYPELGLGIERYGVFCYNKEVRTIVPLPCEYDEENNTITIEAQYMGDLMIIDYESLMFDLGVKYEEIVAAYDVPMVASFMAEGFDDAETGDTAAELGYYSNEVTNFEDLSLEAIENILNFGVEDQNLSTYSIAPSCFAAKSSATKSSAMRQVDLVLVVDTTGSMGSQIATVKRNLSALIYKLRDDGISLYVSVVDYRDITCDGKYSTKVNNNSGVDFYNSVTDITNVIDSLSPYGGGDTPETAIDGLAKAYNLRYNGGSAKFAFLITDANYKNQNNNGISDMTEMANMLLSKNITTSVVTYSSYYKTYQYLVETTDGTLIPMNNDFCDAMYEVICNKTPSTNVVIANDITSGFFKEPLIKGGTCDTDGDTLSDSDEVDWNFVKDIHDDGTYELYTWRELCEQTGFFWSDTAYTDGKLNPLFKTMSGYEVIPATSNPFSPDTDKDYYPDNLDENKLEGNPMYIYDGGINDDNFHDGNPIERKTSDKYTDGELIVSDTNQTARYSFVRRQDEFDRFSLKPDGRSFYKFNLPIDISYEKGWWPFTETVFVEPESDGTYLLDQGIEYTIEINSKTSKNDFSSEYVFTVEQDNWEYAEYGAVCTAHESTTIFDSSDYQSIYISDKALHQIMNNYLMVRLNRPSISYDEFMEVYDNGERNNLNPFYYNCYEYVRYLNEAQTYGDAMGDSINGVVGSLASIAGVFLLMPISQPAAVVVTVVGGGSAVYSIQSGLFNAQVEHKKQEFIDAMYDGKFNFHIYNLSTTTAFMEYHRSEIKSFLPWNTDHYVRKIYANTVYNVDPLTVTTLMELEDGTWRVIP